MPGAEHIELDRELITQLIGSPENVKKAVDGGITRENLSDAARDGFRPVFDYVVGEWGESGETYSPTLRQIQTEFPAFKESGEEPESIGWLIENSTKRRERVLDEEFVVKYSDAIGFGNYEAAARILQEHRSERTTNKTTAKEPRLKSLAEIQKEFGTDPLQPSLMYRADGQAMIYKGRINTIFGKKGSGKSLMAQVTTVQAIQDGKRVAYLDFEKDDAFFGSQMFALGLSAEEAEGLLFYIRVKQLPDGQTWWETLENFDLIVMDGHNTAMGVWGKSYESNQDVTDWYEMVPEMLIERTGAGILFVDHTPHHSDNQIGAMSKGGKTTGSSWRAERRTYLKKGYPNGEVRFINDKDAGGQTGVGEKELGIILNIDFTKTDLVWAINAPDKDLLERLESWSQYEDKMKQATREFVWTSPGLSKSKLMTALEVEFKRVLHTETKRKDIGDLLDKMKADGEFVTVEIKTGQAYPHTLVEDPFQSQSSPNQNA